MANYSACGIDCNNCKFRIEQNCKGCKAIQGTVFWGKCDIFACCNEKEYEHCGKCSSFPCDMLQEWAASENPERIENIKNLN